MQKSKNWEEIAHIAIQAFLIISFAFYWSYFSKTNLMEFIAFVAPVIILISIAILVTKHDRQIIQQKKIRNEIDHQITISAYDELRHDLIAFSAAILILIIAKVFSAKVNTADVLQALVALIFIYLVKIIYFGRIR